MGWTIVTGGAGFIGSHLVDRLVAGGRPVLVVDRRAEAPGGRDNLKAHRGDPRVRIVAGDVARPLGGQLAPFLADVDVDVIVHLAAQVAVVRSLEEPIADAQDNLVGTLEVAKLARDLGARMVFASSAAVYGVGEALPVMEEDAGWPPSPYGIHKLAAEMHLRVQARLSERPLSAVSLRFFNVYGPRQDPASPYAGVIVRFLERALAGLPLQIFGDGLQTRDFIHVADVAQAIVAACERGPSDGTPINIGGGHEISIVELAERIVALTGSASPIVHLPARSGEVRRSRAAVERATTHLGLRPAVDLDRGLVELAAWVAGMAAG
ncbi:MAG: NAD-dependent epimerase/dehydratase family protein [Nannocystaceae bacterium]